MGEFIVLLVDDEKDIRETLVKRLTKRNIEAHGVESGEAALIREAPGGLPQVGFFCSGETSHNRLCGYAGVLTLFPRKPVRRAARPYRLRHNREGETSQ